MKRVFRILQAVLLLSFLIGCEINNSAVIHTVTFYDSFGSTWSVEVQDGKTISKPSVNPVPPQFSTKCLFKSWVTRNADGVETEYDFSKEVKSNLSLFATYYDGYTVSFYDSDGTLLDTESAGIHNSYKISKPESPVSKKDDEGDFNCWKLYDGEEWDFNNTVTSNINLYASYSRAYWVIFYNGDVICHREKVSEGKTAHNPSSDPENINMGSLKGWTTDPSDEENNRYDFSSPVVDTVFLYAYFNECRYVTLVDDEENEIKTLKVDYGTPCPYPDVKSVGNEVIEKWQIKDSSGTWSTYQFTENITDDITLRASLYSLIDTEKALGAMKFSQVLSRCAENEDGEGTTSGFKNSDILELFLSGLNYVDSSTMNYYFPYNDVKYYFYDSDSYLKKPENILYAKIDDSSTGVGSYFYVSKDGSKEITAHNLSIEMRLTEGKVDDEGNVVEDNDSSFTAQVHLNLSYVSLKIDKSGTVTLYTVNSSNVETTTVMSESVSNESTAVLFKQTTGGSESALLLDFCTVTFNPGNGEDTETKDILKGSKISIGEKTPLDSYGSPTFRYWAKGGVKFDFDKKIEENTVLEALYTSHKDFVEKMLKAECIYRIVSILSSYDNLYRETTDVSEIIPFTRDGDIVLTKILLSSLFYMDDSEKLYIPYDGKYYNYEDNTSYYTVYKLSKPAIGKNESKKNGEEETIRIEDFTLDFQFKYDDSVSTSWFLSRLSSTFSLEASILNSTGERITKAKLKTSGKTYDELNAVSRTLDSGKEEVVYDYGGLKFTRIY